MRLEDYLAVQGITQEDFASLTGVSQPHVSLCIARERPVGLSFALRVQDVTCNAVTVEDLLISDDSRLGLETIKALSKSGAFK